MSFGRRLLCLLCAVRAAAAQGSGAAAFLSATGVHTVDLDGTNLRTVASYTCKNCAGIAVVKLNNNDSYIYWADGDNAAARTSIYRTPLEPPTGTGAPEEVCYWDTEGEYWPGGLTADDGGTGREPRIYFTTPLTARGRVAIHFCDSTVIGYQVAQSDARSVQSDLAWGGGLAYSAKERTVFVSAVTRNTQVNEYVAAIFMFDTDSSPRQSSTISQLTTKTSPDYISGLGAMVVSDIDASLYLQSWFFGYSPPRQGDFADFHKFDVPVAPGTASALPVNTYRRIVPASRDKDPGAAASQPNAPQPAVAAMGDVPAWVLWVEDGVMTVWNVGTPTLQNVYTHAGAGQIGPVAWYAVVRQPTASPTAAPSVVTVSPTPAPSTPPTARPSSSPTASPIAPSRTPTVPPSVGPVPAPSKAPARPTTAPTTSPAASPTAAPTASPAKPTAGPVDPTNSPMVPTVTPTAGPSVRPTSTPSYSPSVPPPTASPSGTPTSGPSAGPTTEPSRSPSVPPPTGSPTVPPPTVSPSGSPTGSPRASPTTAPSRAPSVPNPTTAPSGSPTGMQPATDAPTVPGPPCVCPAAAAASESGDDCDTSSAMLIGVLIGICICSMLCSVVLIVKRVQDRNKAAAEDGSYYAPTYEMLLRPDTNVPLNSNLQRAVKWNPSAPEEQPAEPSESQTPQQDEPLLPQPTEYVAPPLMAEDTAPAIPFSVGDTVLVHASPIALEQLCQATPGGWHPDMHDLSGKEGAVYAVHPHERTIVRCAIAGRVWTMPTAALRRCAVPTSAPVRASDAADAAPEELQQSEEVPLGAGDRVFVINDLQSLQRECEASPCGWGLGMDALCGAAVRIQNVHPTTGLLRIASPSGTFTVPPGVVRRSLQAPQPEPESPSALPLDGLLPPPPQSEPPPDEVSLPPSDQCEVAT